MNDARHLASPRERALIRWLIEHAARVSPAGPWLDQVDGLHVVSACDCGCPSLDFVREGMGAGAQILAEAEGEGPGGEPLRILLWARDNAISGLEVFDYDGGTLFPLPSIERLRPAVTLVSL